MAWGQKPQKKRHQPQIHCQKRRTLQGNQGLSYQLEILKSWKIHPVFHASLLTPYKENDIHGPNFPQPPPDQWGRRIWGWADIKTSRTPQMSSKVFTPVIAHCEVHSPILNLYKSFHQTINLEPYQNIKSIKIPIQSGIIHALYQLDALPFFLALKGAPTKHGKRNFCTQCYHLGHYWEDCPFYRCPYCRIMRPRHDENWCLDNPKYSGPNPIKQESPSPPPSPHTKNCQKTTLLPQ